MGCDMRVRIGIGNKKDIPQSHDSLVPDDLSRAFFQEEKPVRNETVPRRGAIA